MFCPKCGNQVNQGVLFCPKCGFKVGPSSSANVEERTTTNQPYSAMSIVGFVTSMISFCLINLWGIVGITGIIFSILGLVNCSNKNKRGKGLAIAGIVIGMLSVLITTIIMIFFSAF